MLAECEKYLGMLPFVLLAISAVSVGSFGYSVWRLDQKYKRPPVDLDAVVDRAPFHKLEEALRNPERE